MNVVEFFQDPARRGIYREWLNNPVTQLVLSVLEEHALPLNMSSTSDSTGTWSEKALYHHGMNVGQSGILRLARTLDSTFDVLQAGQKKPPQPKYNTPHQP